MDLSALWRIRQDTLWGRAVRWPLKRLSPDAEVRVLQGPARGMRWIAGSGPHMYWLGSYEVTKVKAFVRHLTQAAVVFDIGAQAGYYSLVAARKVGPMGKVVAFEPLPLNLSYLRRNVEINRLTNVAVIEGAVADTDGNAFFESGDPSTGHLSDHGLSVRTVSLDAAIARRELPVPSIIKIDVEGGELSVLRGAKRLLQESHPALFLATHGDDVHRACLAVLRNHGYRIHLLAEDEVMAAYDQPHAAIPAR